ncbi:hypothetical protein Sru01_13650 [Sphaerisporangium rufum]|uniref:ABC transporter substrate-binding protein n=1 Tax=Sphaerisporangium rufum TaxID=1381558 RepID=A0A919QYX6_9ACTN|nr:extracellular solute-binding protein [Sphaerisporangium rufum]GII76383.1 hypothetical protein Sru01_13650 [Sphaerisporangium rufum]
MVVLLIFPVIAATAVGSVMVNIGGVPPDALGWLQVCLGATLLAVAAVMLTFIPYLVKLTWRGARTPDDRKVLDQLESIRRNLKNPRRLLAALVALAVLGGVAWTLPGDQGLEPGTIYIMSAQDESGRSGARRILVEQWNEQHPENPVEFIPANGEPDTQHTRMAEDAKPGGTNKADIYLVDIVYMPEFIHKRYIRPLDDSLRQNANQDGDFLRNVLRTCHDMYGGGPGLWCLPLNADAGLLYYRPGASPHPRDWPAYYRSSVNAAHLVDSESLTIAGLEAIWARNGEIVNADGAAVVSPDGAVDFGEAGWAGLRDLVAAYQGKRVDKDVLDAESRGISEFKSGRTPYMRNWPVAYDALRGDGARPFEVETLPHASVLGGQNLAIANSTDKPRAAQALIEFLTSPSSQLILFQIGGFAPTRSNAYTYADRPYRYKLREAVSSARYRPVVLDYPRFSKAFRKGVLQAVRNGGKIDDDFRRDLAGSLGSPAG